MHLLNALSAARRRLQNGKGARSGDGKFYALKAPLNSPPLYLAKILGAAGWRRIVVTWRVTLNQRNALW